MKRAWVVAWTFVVALLLVPAAAGAATFTVNTTEDKADTGDPATECPDSSGASSLRQCIDKANLTAGDDTINFNLPANSTITLVNGNLQINPDNSSDEKLVISGPGAGLLTISGSSSNPDSLLVAQGGVNTISGLTFTGGKANAFQASGIDNESGDMTLDGVIVTGNVNDGSGFNAAGGVLNVFGSMTIRNSTVSNNTVNNVGTGIVFGGGGGVVSHPGDTLIINSTITGNQVHGKGTDMGGGVWNAGGGTITLVNDTISGNSVDGGGGGVKNDDETRAANTIVAGNTSGNGGPDCDTEPFGAMVSQGYNLIGTDENCSFTPVTGDKAGKAGALIDAKLAGLAQNGGPTPTLALLQGSPAINGGNPAQVDNSEPPVDPPAIVPCRNTDQRGIARPQLNVCDIGAYEYAPGEAFAEVPACSTNGQVTITVTPPQGGFAQAVHFQIDNGAEQRVPTQDNAAVVTVPPGRHTLIYWAESQGGDQELSEHTATVLVDNAAPTIRITSDQRKATYTRGSKGSITIKATDALSPLTRNPSKRHRKISTARLGRHTLGFTAVDSCGNKATRTFRYRVVAAARKPVRRRGSTSPRFTG
jgi:hypothetical protein